MSYPKPKGWDGGPDGTMLRQGMTGHLSWNPNTDMGEKFAQEQDDEGSWERRNHVDVDYISHWGEEATQR